MVRQQISPTACAKNRKWQSGFTLLEVLCTLAILSLLAAIIVPALPRGTSKSGLQGLALSVAGVLKADRNAAMRRQTQIATHIDTTARLVQSGATGRVVRVPPDVSFDTLLSAGCNQDPSDRTIRFFSSGMSCGGVIVLARSGIRYQIQVNWMTGGVEVAS